MSAVEQDIQVPSQLLATAFREKIYPNGAISAPGQTKAVIEVFGQELVEAIVLTPDPSLTGVPCWGAIAGVVKVVVESGETGDKAIKYIKDECPGEYETLSEVLGPILTNRLIAGIKTPTPEELNHFLDLVDGNTVKSVPAPREQSLPKQEVDVEQKTPVSPSTQLGPQQEPTLEKRQPAQKQVLEEAEAGSGPETRRDLTQEAKQPTERIINPTSIIDQVNQAFESIDSGEEVVVYFDRDHASRAILSLVPDSLVLDPKEGISLEFLKEIIKVKIKGSVQKPIQLNKLGLEFNLQIHQHADLVFDPGSLKVDIKGLKKMLAGQIKELIITQLTDLSGALKAFFGASSESGGKGIKNLGSVKARAALEESKTTGVELVFTKR